MLPLSLTRVCVCGEYMGEKETLLLYTARQVYCPLTALQITFSSSYNTVL